MNGRSCISVLYRVLAALLVVSLPIAAESPQKQSNAPSYGEIATAFSRRMPALHLEMTQLDEATSERIFKLYINLLDNDHSMFLASDIEKARTRERSLADMLKNGDVSLAFEMVSLLRKRVAERCDYVDALLKDGISVDAKEELLRDRRTSPWPTDLKEQNDLWRKIIKDQYIRHVLDAELRHKKGDGKVDAPKTEVKQPKAGTEKIKDQPEAKPDKEIKVPTPEELISKRYRQLLSMLKDMDDDTIFQQYMSAVARSFDPHSDYMSASTSEDFDISMKLSLVGIGALLTSEDGAAKVVRIIPGGAAASDGRLKPGDKIIAVGQGEVEPVDVLHWPLTKTVRLIRGPKGTVVVLVVIPAADSAGSGTVKLSLVRDDVKLEDAEAKGTNRVMKAAGDPARKLGVISLPSFYSDMKARNGGEEFKSSSRDVKRILQGMVEDGVQGVVLDLRNNGGGSLSEAVEMTGLFIKTGPVVQVKDKRAITVLQDEEVDTVYAGPLVVMVDRMSASASEILAAALQDYGRAVIVGDSRTHGKGTVQSVVPIRNSKLELGTLKVTTATFYRFTGKSTQREGVASDIQVPSPLQALEIGEEYLEYALPWSRIAAVDFGREAARSVVEDLLFWRTPRDEDDCQKVVDCQALIGVLRTKSEERRKKDSRFTAREELLKSFAARQKKSTVSLKLAERREQAKEEMRLDELQRLSMDDSDEGEKKQDGGGLVLEEALNILSDMVTETRRSR
ncbi:MAG: carboxy terminal-processing peptidase [bacterium]